MTLDVALVVVGDELLRGTRADGNGPWMAAQLAVEGACLVGLEICGDAAEEVAAAVRRAAARASHVLVSGGLGPTDDDGTRAGIARAAGVALREHPEALRHVEAAQAARGFALDARRRREALLPDGAAPLQNPFGTAPGIEMPMGDGVLWALPGVPREVRQMFTASIVPRLRRLGGLEPACTRAFRVAGVREPDVAETLKDLAALPDAALGLYPHEGELEIRFTGTARDEAGVERAAAEAARRLAPVYPNVGIERHVVETLLARALTVTTAESVTGGRVAAMLTSVPRASEVFRGGWVTYSDAWKAEALGVPPELLEAEGAVSEAVARRMAEGARQRAAVTAALAVTGIAGPGDGRTPDGRVIPQGTCYVALAYASRATAVTVLRAPHERTTVQHRAAVTAFDMLRRAIAASGGGASA